MTKERKHKERGAKIYEAILHIFAIGSIVLALDGSGLLAKYDFKLMGPSENWWFWLIITGVAVLRLYVLQKLKEAAYSQGLLLTEFTEKLEKENGKK